MEKIFTLHFLKSTLFFSILFLFGINSNVNAQIYQAEGVFIPLTKTYPDDTKGDPPIIRGNMSIIGNSILGPKFTVVDSTSSGSYSNYVELNSSNATRHKDYDVNDDFNVLESSSGFHIRGYIDVDSDPDRDTKYLDGGTPIYQNLINSEATYLGMTLRDGSPTVDSGDPNLLTNGEPLLDDFGAPNYGEWRDGSASIVGPFLPGSEEGTFSSSSAELRINSTTEDCSKIQRAYLYWGGLYTGEAFSASRNRDNFTTITRLRPECVDENGDPCEMYTDIKILPPGASEYIDIKHSNSGVDHTSLKTDILYDDGWVTNPNATGSYNNRTNRELGYAVSNFNKYSDIYPSFSNYYPYSGWTPHPSYACRADVTSLMEHLQNTGQSVDGFWTVANIRTTVGQKGYGLGAGWSLVVVYEDPNAPQRYITFFDGYVNVNGTTADLNISGFTTVPAGPVNVEFASISLEGDIDLTNDNFKINGVDISAIKPADATSNIGYDSSNYFDSSILSIDRSPSALSNLNRYPNSNNALGYDSDHFELDNSGNSIIGNGDTSAFVEMTTGAGTSGGNDQTATYFSAFSIEVIAPDLVVTKQVFREDGTPIEIGNDIVDLGDKIVYEIVIENVGNEEAVYTQFQDLIPINTIFNFADSDFRFNNIPLSETEVGITTGDSGEVDGDGNPISTTLITYDIDDSVNSNGDPDGTNGLLEPGESVEITFSVQVVTDCSLLRNACSGYIENQADVSYSTLIDGSEFEIQSAFEVDNCDVADPAPTPFLADQASCFIDAGEISQCEEFILLQAGLGYDEYIWFFNGSPFNTDAQGNPTLNQDEIVVNVSGNYTVNELLTLNNDCQDVTLSFDVNALDTFDPGVDPFENINADYKNELLCSDTGRNEVTEILLCAGSQVIGSDIYPAGTSLSWQELDTAAGCTQVGYCPYPNSNGTGSACYVEFDTSNTYTFDRAGDFRLTVTLPGGCPFDYYFKTIEFNVNPEIQLTSGGGCAGDAELTVAGVPSDYLFTFREDDENGAILQGPTTTNTYTLADPNAVINEKIYVEAVPDIPNYDGCVFSDDIVVEFSNLSWLTEPVITQPVCFTDQDTGDGIDDSKGHISFQAAGAPNYSFELINDDTGNAERGIFSALTQGTSNDLFNNIPPGEYTLRVYSANYPITGETTPTSCFLERDITINEFYDFDVTIDLVQLTCQPAQVDFDLDTSEPTPDYSQFTTRLVFMEGTPDEVIESFSGETGSILIADTLNTPNSGTDDDGNVIPDDGFEDLNADVYIDDLLANGVTATLQVFKTGTGSCAIERTVVINPFTPLTLEITSPRQPSCRNDANGQVKVRVVSGDNVSDITSYEITAADDASQIGKVGTSGGVFTDLTAGEYTFTAYQDIDGTICSAEVTYTLEEPEEISTPIIEAVQPYTCETNEGHIDLQSGFTITGGNSPYTYRLLKYTDAALTILEDTREVNNIARLPYESLTDGFYVLEVEDRNNCTSELSNVIEFEPLSEVTLTLDANPLLTCDSTTTPVEISATATNGGVIEGYSLVYSSNTSVATFTDFSNTTGQFDLPAGDYEVVARTTNTLCESDPLPFTVEDLVNIAAIKTGGRETLTCVGADDGSASYSISGIGANGYSYTITKDAAAYTPAASNPQPSTNLTATAFLLEDLEVGVYEITFTDAYTNCMQTANFAISDPSVAVVSLITAPQYNCSDSGIGTYRFVVGATDGESPYTFTDGTTSNTDGVFTVNATASEQTITINITDDNSCPGTPLDVTIPATDDLQLTQTTIEQCLTDGDDITVAFTGGVEPIQYKLDGAATFTTATVSGGTFTIDTNITVAGSYTYLIVDANNNESCARELEVIFYDDIDISNLSTTTLSCNASGAVPTTGASITFEVNGGVGAYTYTYETSSISATALTPDGGSTDANPTFTFDDSFDEEEITITIANASGCGVPTTLTYTPNYPEVPTINSIDIPTFICDGETIEVEITPTFETGEDANSFVYIFDGVEQNSNTKQYTEGTTSFTYAIRRISSGCISTTLNGALNTVDPIQVGTITTTPEICMPLTKGTATIPIINGTGPYEVTVTNLDDSSLAPIVQSTSTNTITFDPLEIGDHLVEITDDNGCVLTDRVEFRIIPEPNFDFDEEEVVPSCDNKVTFFFEIVDGVGPFEIGLSTGTLVDPTTFGDDISNYNDPEFPATLYATVDPGAASGINYNRVYAVTRLEFDQSYTVFVQDTNTSCFSSATVDPEPSLAVDITLGTSINTGACALNSGEIPFEFSIIDGSSGDYIAEIINSDGSIDTSITPQTITVPPSPAPTDVFSGTLTGLPAGSHILRIRPADPANECSGTADFLIGTEPAMGPLEIAFSRGSSCSEAAQLELRVAGGGRMPYEFLLMPSGDTPDDSTIFTETATISETTILSFTDTSGNLIADAFVKDASGCISDALAINIAPLVEPTLTLAPSPEDCKETGLFTTAYTIGNFDAGKLYTFTVNGDIPGNSQITITSPDASGEGTVSAQNRDTYSIEVTASDNPACPATATFELAEDVINISATLDEPDCDGNLDFITVEVVSGGYVGIPTRQLTYEVYDGATVGSGTLIATVTPSPLDTNITFNAGTDYGSGPLSLTANTDYSVRVVDVYDATATPLRQCDDEHEGLRVVPVDLPEPVTVLESPLSCSTANNGEIELGITGTSPSIVYELYEFPNATDAQMAIDNSLVEVSGTEITSNSLFVDGNIFSNLQGVSNAAYVGVAYVTNLSCPIYSIVIDLDEPVNTPATSFVIAGIDGNCDSTDLVTDALPQVTIEIAGALPSALTDYEISISPSVGSLTNPFTFADLSLVGGVYVIDANSVPSQTYTISISDTTTTCPPLEYTQTVFCDTELDQLGIAITNPPILCFDPAATSTVSFEVTAANGNPLLFDYSVTTKDDPSTILDSGTDETTSPVTIAVGLAENEYVLTVKDKNEDRIPPVIREFEITMPDNLPDFSLAQDRTGCDAIEITATPVTDSGTPNVSDPAYTFEISADGTTFTAMIPTVTGAATATVTPPTTGTDTYTVRITDANSCPNTKTIEVAPQEQLTASVAVDAVCLNEGDANAVITITTGTAPFTFVRTNTGTGAVENGTITNTSFPIEVDNAISESGTYEYVITDDFGCTTAALPVTIEDELTLNVIPVPASTACDAMNNPLSSEYQLTVGGGDLTYTYEVAIGETAINTNNFVSYAGPNYTVDPSQDGERFVFRVSDGLGCEVVFEPALITFPTFPEVTFSDIVDIECPGANGSALLTVTSGTGKAPYEIFVTETGTAFPTTALAGDPLAGITFTTATEGTFDYKVIDDNGCESAVGQFAISNSVITLKNFDIQDITCSASMVVDNSGSITLSVSNAESDIVFTLFEDGNPIALDTHTESVDDEHTFDMLTAGDYTIEVIDTNNCDTPFRFEATINTNADIVIGDYQVINEDCTPAGSGITIAFPVDGVGTILIQDPINGGGVVDPTNTGDNIFKYDDALDPFPNSMPPTTLGADDLFYVASNLAADTEYTIIVQDGSNCQEERVFRTPANDEIVNLTANVIPESNCSGLQADGEIAVDFEIGTSIALSFDVYLYNEDETAQLDSATGVLINAGGPEYTFTGLTGDLDYVVRVTENGESALCGNPIEVEVPLTPELILDMPSYAAANCSNGFVVPLTASAQFGIPPYEFDIVPAGGTPTYPGTDLEADTNAGVDLIWDVYVRDSSVAGCEKMIQITITNEPEPTFTIDPEFSVDQCENAVASYTVSAEITNYDANLEPYTFTLNGSAITPTTMTLGVVEFEVPNRDNYTIEVSDKNSCTADDSIIIYELFEVSATLGNVDCNGDVADIVATVTGGYNEPTRGLTYEVFAVNNLSTAITTVSGTTDTNPTINVAGLLSPNTDYVVVATDNFTNATPSIAPSCSATSNTMRFEEVEKSNIKATPQDVSCNGDNNGIVLIEDITVGEIPVTYSLYSYASIGAANNASTNNDPLTGTNVSGNVNATNERLFENLPVGFYVAFVQNGTQACYTASEAVEIEEPALFTGTGFDAQPIQADCATPPTVQGIEVSITAALDGEAPYFYRVPGLVENFTEITDVTIGSSFMVPGVVNTNTTYTVEFTDASGIVCVPAVTIPVTIDPFTGNPNLDLITQNRPYDCFDEENITIGITNRLGAENYTFTNISAINFDGLALPIIATPSTTDITSEFEIPVPGRYIFQATSSLGCVSNEFEYIVRELDQLSIEAIGSIVACFGDTSTIEFDVLNYAGDFSFEIEDTDNAIDYTGGMVTDWGGTPSVIAPAGLTASINADGLVEVDGLPVANYEINIVGSTNPRCQNTEPAIAQIIGPDDAVNITSAEAITDITCLVEYAEVQIEADGGFGNYTYEIVNATPGSGTLATPVSNTTGFFSTLSQIGEGTYTISVTDTDNPLCTPATTSLTIDAPVEPTLNTALNSFSILCYEGNTDMRVELANTPTANTDDLRYSLYTFDGTAGDNRGGARILNQAPNTSETFVIFTGIEAGEYLAEVSDIFGCVFDHYPITVTEPALLEASAVVSNPFSCDNPDMEEWTVNATGGTGPYTYDYFTETDTQLNAVTSNIATESSEGVFNISPFRILTVQVTDDNGCTTTTVIETGKTIDPIEYDITYTTNKICFGETDGFVSILNDVVTGGEGDYVYTLYESNGTTIVNTSNTENFFGDLPAGDYVYEVSSNNCDVVTRNFTIEEEPEINEDISIIEVSCRGADDAEVTISVLDDAANRFETPVSFTYTLNADDGSFSASFTKDDLNDPALFQELEAGLSYTYTILNNNTIGCFKQGTFTIDDKTDIIVQNFETSGGLCDGDVDGAIQMEVTGGTRTASGSYYYEIRTDFLNDPDLGTIKASGNELIPVTGDTTGNLFTVMEVFDTNVPYEIVIVDEGNLQDGDDFRACINYQEFIFETENLDNYTVSTVANCETLGYTISATNGSEVDDPSLLRIYVYNLDNSIAATGGSNLADVDVMPGNYYVTIGNEVTGCRSITPVVLDELEAFEPVQFIQENEFGEAIQPFTATNEINVYRLQVEGGVLDPDTGLPSYVYEATYTDLNGNLFIFEVEEDGTFEVEGPGYYTFIVYDDEAEEGEGCSDMVGPIGLNYIEIDIPNVFNPTSGDPLMNTWYPDNLTTDFTKNGVNNPLLSDDPDTPQIPIIIENTGGVVTGGTTTNGTTTGGYVVGGDIASNTSTVPIEPITSGTSTVTYTTIGGTTTGGETSGGYIIETITNASGVENVRIYTGGIIEGGTTTTGGVVTGGTFINENSDEVNVLQTVPGVNDNGETIYTITIDGTTTGGTTTGGTTSGGVTIGDTTTGGTTTGATIVNGTTIGGTTIVITEDTASNTTIEAFTNTTINGGTASNGTTTGGTTVGGSLSGGISTPIGIEFIDYQNIEVMIFDRYGRLLAEFQGIEEKNNGGKGWDGTYQGKQMPSGDYWYVIKLNDSEGREFTGHFTLYRR